MLLRHWALILLVVGLAGCATTAPESASMPEGTEIADAEVSSMDDAVTSDNDFSSQDSPDAATNATPVAPTTEPEAPLAEVPAPAPMTEPSVADTVPSQIPESTPSPSVSVPDGAAAVITALDFNADENGGTVVVKTDREVTYTTRKNEKNNQFIVELENTTVPKRFQRPYTTKEFPGAIASINAYQGKGGATSARIVLQLRDAADPGVSQMGKTLNISATGGGAVASAGNGGGESASTEPPQPNIEESAAGGSEAGGELSVGPGVAAGESGKIMNNKSFDSFLLGQTKFYGRPISIETTNQDIREIFKFISEESGLNIILDDDVTGKTTMKLKKVPWDQVLTILLQSKQLGYVRNGSILRIASLRTLTSESTVARQVMDAQKNLQVLRVQVYPVSYAKAEDMSSQVKDLLTSRGRATADRRTNTLVVTDIPEVLSKVKALINKLDTQTPQVLIEARIVEARDSFNRAVGLTWGANGATLGTGSGAMSATASMGSALTSSNQNLGLTVGNLDTIGNLTTTLRFLENEGLVKVISSPRIVALDRTSASIEQTTQQPIFNTTVNQITQLQTTNVTFQDFKLMLKVTPQITIDGGIIMDIDVTREFAGTQAIAGGSSAFPNNRRHANTQILVENGDTAVIGGIYQSDVTTSESGMPWFRKIPLLGWLFGKSESIIKEKNELVIFLSPKILNRDKAFVRADTAM